jgi:hypothetical protein
MPDYDASQLHADTVAYYRLTLELHRKDPTTINTVPAEEEQLRIVQETPDAEELNRKFMEGGLALLVNRAMAADEALREAANLEAIANPELAQLHRRKAEALLKVTSYDELMKLAEEWDIRISAERVRNSRLDSLINQLLPALLAAEASPNPSMAEGPLATIKAHTEELRRDYNLSLAEALELPRIRARIFYSPEQRRELVAMHARHYAGKEGAQ